MQVIKSATSALLAIPYISILNSTCQYTFPKISACICHVRVIYCTIMSRTCDLCGKGKMRGNQISITRSQVSRRTTKHCNPNLQKETIDLGDGQKITCKLCTKCKKTIKP